MHGRQWELMVSFMITCDFPLESVILDSFNDVDTITVLSFCLLIVVFEDAKVPK